MLVESLPAEVLRAVKSCRTAHRDTGRHHVVLTLYDCLTCPCASPLACCRFGESSSVTWLSLRHGLTRAAMVQQYLRKVYRTTLHRPWHGLSDILYSDKKRLLKRCQNILF
jgi:hypothetical protein